MPDAARAPRLGVGVFSGDVDGLVEQGHAAARGPDHAAQHLEQFGLAIASDARDAKNFAAPDLEGHALEPVHAAAPHAQILDLEDHIAGFGGRLVDLQQHLAAHHHLGQFGRGCLGGLDRIGHLAPAHHADGVGDLHDLAQLVGDQDDRFPLRLEPFEDAEQLIRL